MIPIYFTIPFEFTKRFLLRQVFQDKLIFSPATISLRIETTVCELIDF